jgi:hypothetical protein
MNTMIGHALIAIEDEEYKIGNIEEVENLILDLKKGSRLHIRWLGTLEVIAVCDNTYYRMKEGIERKMVMIYCKKVVA